MTKKKHSARERRVYAQGVLWVGGTPQHNFVDDECTPDFSCCVPALFEFDKEKRRDIVNRWCREHHVSALPLDA